MIFEPAKTLDQATRALNADEPLHGQDSRYQDLSAACGENPLKRMERLFLHKQQGLFEHAVFASHRGAGKSTELWRLMDRLKERYHCLYFEANVEMDATQIELEDLLLVLCRQIDLEMKKLELPLDPALLKEVGDWFSEIIAQTSVGQTYRTELESQAKLGHEVPIFGGLTSRLTSLFKVESEHRRQVRDVLRKYPGTLMDRCNQLLKAAHKLLKANKNKDLLIIVDNLDRYAPNVIDQLLVQQGDRFTSLACDMILTPPIILVYKPTSGSLNDYFNVEVLPAVRLRKSSEDAYDSLTGPGVEPLRSALSLRISLERLIPDRKHQDRLLLASGGSIRELLNVVGDAVLRADGVHLSEQDVTGAVNKLKGNLRNRMNANGWGRVLARISVAKQTVEDDACMQVLHQRLAFQYNGDTWHDIHPLIAELPEFQKALQALQTTP